MSMISLGSLLLLEELLRLLQPLADKFNVLVA
jgi:hypothetical protein